MSKYSVAEAKNGLPSLIDRALAGEEVIITRRGAPVAELRSTAVSALPDPWVARDAYARIKALREKGPTLGITSVQLLRQMYDETPW